MGKLYMRAFCALSAQLMLFYSGDAFALVAPVQTDRCDVSKVGVGAPSGLAYNPLIDALVVTDIDLQQAFVLSKTCELFDVLELPGTTPTGITFDPIDRRYVVLDGNAARLHFVALDGGGQGSCSLDGVGDAKGITYDPSVGALAVLSDGSDELLRVATTVTDHGPCPVLSRDSLALLGITHSDGLTFDAVSQRLIVVDGLTDEVWRLTPTLELVDSFGIGVALNAGLSAGMTFDSGSNRYYIVDEFDLVIREVDARGSAQFKCSLNPIVDHEIIGAVLNSTDGVLVLLHDEPAGRELLYVREDTCEIIRRVNIGVQGAQLPSGVGWDRLTREIVVSDPAADALFFFDYDSGERVDSCSTLDPGFFGSAGVSVIPEFGWYLLTDSGDTIVVLNRNCEHITQNSTRFFGGEEPGDITYRQRDGRALVVGRSPNNVYVVTLDGRSDVVINNPATRVSAAIVLPEPARFLTVDEDGLNFFEFYIPLLEETQSLSGSYRGGLSKLLTLLPLGDGFFSARLDLDERAPPTWAYWQPDTRRLQLTIRDDSGEALTLIGVVSADMNRITFPAPIGNLIRVLGAG